MISEAIAKRAVSSFPLSIGTALAFESLFDPVQARYDSEREIPPRVDLTNYSEMYLNVFTLFRNMAGSLDKGAFDTVKPQDFCDALLYEMEVIENLFNQGANGQCKPVFYFCTYEHLMKHAHKNVMFRADKTAIQLAYRQKMLATIKELNKYTDVIVKCDSDIKPPKRVPTLMLSHFAYDLVSRQNFAKLDLLESHTGVLKGRFKWYTKFYALPNADMSIIPFHKKLLLIFGDSSLITPMDRKLRLLIHESAKKRNWNAATTLEKVMLDLSIDIKEPYVLDVIRHL